MYSRFLVPVNTLETSRLDEAQSNHKFLTMALPKLKECWSSSMIQWTSEVLSPGTAMCSAAMSLYLGLLCTEKGCSFASGEKVKPRC